MLYVAEPFQRFFVDKNIQRDKLSSAIVYLMILLTGAIIASCFVQTTSSVNKLPFFRPTKRLFDSVMRPVFATAFSTTELYCLNQ